MLEKLFKNHKIYGRLVFMGLLSTTAHALFAIAALEFFIFVFSIDIALGSFVRFILLLLVQIIVFVTMFFLIRSYLYVIYIKKLIGDRSYLGSLAITDLNTKIGQSSIILELEEFNQAQIIKKEGFWQLYDITFNVYWQAKSRRYKAREVYYTVFEAKFDYMSPHTVFDSITAKEKQFKYLYLESQKMQLGAGFDEHFETYAPKYYEIDILSFITPEIMEKIVAIKDCDIEFIQGSMLCYAPLLRKEQLALFSQKCLALREAVNNNLASYRDSWQGRGASVTEFGKQLLENPGLLAAILFGSLSAFIIFNAITDSLSVLFDPESWIVIFLFVLSLIAYIKKTRHNKKMESDFRKSVVGNDSSENRIKNSEP